MFLHLKFLCEDYQIYDSKEATIKNYTEALPDYNSTGIWIALNEGEIDNQDKAAKATDEMTESFHLRQHRTITGCAFVICSLASFSSSCTNFA